ncbi:MAG TPA: DUF3098 domain-containing protein [Candidatus Cryptobacteroides sp.]|jgi:Ca2+/H+ antiporter|nr:DUF3098 domain-containing protein [Candidatus Cryptobacteroides sp.]
MDEQSGKLAITRKGIILMIIGVVVMALGFVLLSGGGLKDPQVFNWSMFSFRRLVLAPVVIVAGLVVIVIGIMRKKD